MHLLVASPLDIPSLQQGLGLVPDNLAATDVASPGHPVNTELAIALAPRVDQLDLVTLASGIDRPVSFRGDRVRAFVGPSRPRARTRALDMFAAERSFVAEVIRRRQPDVVSAHWTYEYALGALEAPTPTLITVHDWAPAIFRYQTDRYRALRLAMQMLCLRRGEHFAAVSPYMAQRAEWVVRQTVTVLPNAVGDSWLEARPAKLAGSRVVAANNEFGRRKNVTSLLHAWPHVLKQVPDADLVLTGVGYSTDGPAAAWARSHGLDQGVTFLGPMARSELQGVLSGARVFVHPSREESFGMVVLEAMSLGLPVVGGSRSGAVPWLLENNSGVLVDVKDPKVMARAILSLLLDRSLALRVGKQARSRAREQFSSAESSELYLRRLQDLL